MKRLWLIGLVILLTACGQPAEESETGGDGVAPAPQIETDESEVNPAEQALLEAAAENPELSVAQLELTQSTIATPDFVGVNYPEITDLRIETIDGLGQAATIYPSSNPPPSPGVILLHMSGSNRAVWSNIAPFIAERGYVVLTLDLRGHGDTGGDVDWDLASNDLQRAWSFFASQPEVDIQQTAIVGASLGSSVALIGGADLPQVQTVVLLSPGLNYQGVTTTEAISGFGDRPLLIVASEEDTYSADSSRELESSAFGMVSLVIYQDAGHGTAMFSAQPDLTNLILDWLNTQVTPQSAEEFFEQNDLLPEETELPE